MLGCILEQALASVPTAVGVEESWNPAQQALASVPTLNKRLPLFLLLRLPVFLLLLVTSACLCSYSSLLLLLSLCCFEQVLASVV